MSPPGEDAADGLNRGVELQDSSTIDDGQWEDYTCQGSWEDFIRSLEGVLRDWKSCNTGASDTGTCSGPPHVTLCLSIVDKQELWCRVSGAGRFCARLYESSTTTMSVKCPVTDLRCRLR